MNIEQIKKRLDKIIGIKGMEYVYSELNSEFFFYRWDYYNFRLKVSEIENMSDNDLRCTLFVNERESLYD